MSMWHTFIAPFCVSLQMTDCGGWSHLADGPVVQYPTAEYWTGQGCQPVVQTRTPIYYTYYTQTRTQTHAQACCFDGWRRRYRRVSSINFLRSASFGESPLYSDSTASVLTATISIDGSTEPCRRTMAGTSERWTGERNGGGTAGER